MDTYRNDKRAIQEFAFKTTTKILVIMLIACLVFLIAETPVLTNDIAMGQMAHSDEAFIAMSAFQKFRGTVNLVQIILDVCILVSIGWDGYKLAKTLTSEPDLETENEKEN